MRQDGRDLLRSAVDDIQINRQSGKPMDSRCGSSNEDELHLSSCQ
jgi:hypothetical protein